MQRLIELMQLPIKMMRHLMFSKIKTRALLYIILAGLAGIGIGILVMCSQVNEYLDRMQDEPFRLKVALYPTVPNAESLMNWIEKDFESRYPEIDLVLRPLHRTDNADYGDLSYEYDKAEKALTTKGLDSQHIIEIDTMILGKLIEAGAVQKFNVDNGVSFLDAAVQAVTWKDGIQYGVPHWTCGYFVISRLEKVPQAKNLDELLSVLKKDGDEQSVDLVGALDGSWTSIMIYLDGFRDTHPERDFEQALTQWQAETRIWTGFRRVGEACKADQEDFCSKKDPKPLVNMFVEGEADALIGYSESLHDILKADQTANGKLHVASATLGEGDRPMLFTDALVLSPNCFADGCEEAARAFAEYYVSDRVFEVLLMGHDMEPPAVPRYLLPATKSAFDVGDVGKDTFYKRFKQEAEIAGPYPNRGVPEARQQGKIRKEMLKALAGQSTES